MYDLWSKMWIVWPYLHKLPLICKLVNFSKNITIVFYTLHLTCMQTFAAIGSETAKILGGGGSNWPCPSKNLVWNSPVKIGLSQIKLVLSCAAIWEFTYCLRWMATWSRSKFLFAFWYRFTAYCQLHCRCKCDFLFSKAYCAKSS